MCCHCCDGGEKKVIPSSFSDAFETLQTKTVQPGEESIVFFGQIPKGNVGFLYNIASNYSDGVTWSWFIDDEPIESDVMEPLGDMNSPMVFEPPYVVKMSVRVVAKNESEYVVDLSVFCDGKYFLIPDKVQPSTLFRPLMLQPLEVQTQEEKSVRMLLSDIKEEIQNQVPAGVSDDKYLAVTDVICMYTGSDDGPLNYTSCSVVNTGPNNVYVSVNEWNNPEAPITPGESQNFDFSRRGAIKKIFLICNAGETANVKIHAMK